MAEDRLHQPHDTLFKAAFGNKGVFIDFLKNRLPKETLQLVDLHSLQLTNKSFVSKAGKHSHSDLIYRALLQHHTGYVYLVIEHFSTPQEDIPLRQLEYNLALFRQHLNEGHKKLPLPINICIYSGDQPYSGPINALAMFEHPDPVRCTWLEDNHLTDLYSDKEGKILQDGKAAWGELLLKGDRKRDYLQFLDNHRELIQKQKVSYAEEAILYILSRDGREEVLEKLKEITQPQYKNLVMSIVEKYTQKGRQQGMQTKTLDIARSMLHDKAPISKILRWTGLNEAQLRGLQS